MAAHPEQRAAQKALALDVTTRVHGEAAAAEAVSVSEALFQREPITDPALLASVHEATRGPSSRRSMAAWSRSSPRRAWPRRAARPGA